MKILSEGGVVALGEVSLGRGVSLDLLPLCVNLQMTPKRNSACENLQSSHAQKQESVSSFYHDQLGVAID
jgi:hypothetical protein